jgi:hypothetical protein
LVVLNGLLVFPTHQRLGPLSLVLYYLPDAASVQLHSIVFQKPVLYVNIGISGTTKEEVVVVLRDAGL